MITTWRLSKDKDLASHVTSEISGASKITIHARSKYIPFRKFAVVAEINGEEAMEAFWDSNESISCM